MFFVTQFREREKVMEHITKRKHLKKETAKRLGVSESDLEWMNGKLCRNGVPVQGVETVVKPPKAPKKEETRAAYHPTRTVTQRSIWW